MRHDLPIASILIEFFLRLYFRRLKSVWAIRHSLEGPKTLPAALMYGAQSELALIALFCQH